MRRLIVNADDFGLTELVSMGILDAHRFGIVSSTTLMANGAAFDTAVRVSRAVPDLGIGVHLNLTQGAPVSSPSQIPSLVNPEGHLHLSPGQLLRRILTRNVCLAQIETELRAQIEKVFSAGILPTHLDGHKHVHVLPGVSEIVIRLAQEFSIPCVRCPKEAADSILRCRSRQIARAKQYLKGRAVSALAWRFEKQLSRAWLGFSANFFGLSETGFLDGPAIESILEDLPEGTSELMCHPGYFDDELLKAGTRLLAQRQTELFALTAMRTMTMVAGRGIQLATYRDLAFPDCGKKVAA